ncbi:TPA: site-2 protease family protein [Candidatus Falkowbacteria bacterium]|nr:MAG: Peptidase, M50 family [Candidatus Falkowbacteria bacterium GW2011_GWF2_43_32]HBA36783.1 site-2 protease family protein [Candidatus Falkowbacteria bacterium]
MIEIFQIIVFIFSAIAHEYMHGWMAYRLGDSTAKNAGRLTLNPLAHLEWFGSFFLPLVMIITKMPFVFGWAKPVPYNPYNLKDRKYGEAKVALAGPLANFIIALSFGLLIRVLPVFNITFIGLLGVVVYINLVLMVFNLVPIPPLDGSKILAVFLSPSVRARYLGSERAGFILIILFVMLAGGMIIPIVNFLFRMIVGS